MNKAFCFSILILGFSVSSYCQTISEIVYTWHYTYKCAYCGQIKKEEKLDLSTIKDPDIYNNAFQYGIINGAMNNSGYEEKKICDISRSGEHRYELIKKNRTQDTFSVDKSNNKTNSSSNKSNSKPANPIVDNKKNFRDEVYNTFYDYNKIALKNRSNINAVSQAEADLIFSQYDAEKWYKTSDNEKNSTINNILAIFHHGNKYKNDFVEAVELGTQGWHYYKKGDLRMALENTNQALTINDSIPPLIGNKALFELINAKPTILKRDGIYTDPSIFKFDFWLSYTRFHNVVFKEYDRNIQRVYVKAVIDDLNDLRSKTSISEKLFRDAIDLLLTTFLNEDLAFIEARLNENRNN